MKQSKLCKDSLILISHRFFGVSCQILLTYYLARALSVSDFSKWSFVQSLVLIFSLLDFPLVSALQNIFVKYRCEKNEEGFRLLFYSCFQMMGIIVITMTPILYALHCWYPQIFWLYSSVYVLFLKSLFQFPKAALFADQKIAVHTIAETISQFCAALFVLVSLKYSWPIQTLLTGYCSLFSMGAFYSLRFVSVRNKWRWAFTNISQMKEFFLLLVRPLTLLFFQNMAAIFLFSADVTLIYYLCDSFEVSQFYLYQRIFNGVLIITLPITTVAWVRFTADFEKGLFQNLEKTLFSICKISLLVIAFVGGFLCITHERIVFFLSGHLWSSSIYCFSFLVYIALVTFQSIFSTALNAIGYHDIQLKSYAVLVFIKALIILSSAYQMNALHILWITNAILLPMIGVNLWKWLQILADRKSLYTQ